MASLASISAEIKSQIWGCGRRRQGDDDDGDSATVIRRSRRRGHPPCDGWRGELA
jgi:hypothetical protein